MSSIDPTIIIALVTFITGILSVVATMVVALLNVKGAQGEASDEISSGASELLREYKEIRKQDKETIAHLSDQICKLEVWRQEVNDFIIPVFEGAHKLKEQVIELQGVPVYNPPPRPEWLKRSIRKIEKEK